MPRSFARRDMLLSPTFTNYLDTIPGLIRFPSQENDGATTIRARVNGAYNSDYDGSIVSATVAQPAPGNLNYAYLYDAINGHCPIHSAALVAAFDGDEGSAFAFCKVANAGVWADGQTRSIIRLLVDGDNFILGDKTTTDLRVIQSAGGTAKTVQAAITTTTDYFMFGLTWSATNDQVIAYFNGYQMGAIQTGLGSFVGDLSATDTAIGAATTVPTLLWSGNLTEIMIATRPLAPDEIAEIDQRSGI